MNKIRNSLLASGTPVPTTKFCDWLGLPRSTAYYQPRASKACPVDEAMAARIRQLHQSEPACGVRGTRSRLRFRDGHLVKSRRPTAS